MIILGAYSNSHVNDKQEFMSGINAVPEELLVKISAAVADVGYITETNVTDCEQKNIIPIISISR